MNKGREYNSGPRVRAITILTLKRNKLMKILNTGRIVRKGVERKISELDIEKYGFQLERCEKEIARLGRARHDLS
jgi:hypothetical protein